jgi:hypothetical protein
MMDTRTRRDCLAYFDVARDYRSVYRRNDLSIAKVGLGSMKRCLKLGDCCLVVLRPRLRLLIGIARLVDRFLGFPILNPLTPGLWRSV